MRRSGTSLWLTQLRAALGPPPLPPRRYFSSRGWAAVRTWNGQTGVGRRRVSGPGGARRRAA
jgi:hypothetical protein